MTISIVFIFLFAPPGRRLRKPHMRQRQLGSDRNKLVQYILSENLIHALAASRDRRRYQDGVSRGMEFEMPVRMRQRIMRDQGCDMGELRRFGFQELLACWGIEEKIANSNR